jgi:hypothetical protein
MYPSRQRGHLLVSTLVKYERFFTGVDIVHILIKDNLIA